MRCDAQHMGHALIFSRAFGPVSGPNSEKIDVQTSKMSLPVTKMSPCETNWKQTRSKISICGRNRVAQAKPGMFSVSSAIPSQYRFQQGDTMKLPLIAAFIIITYSLLAAAWISYSRLPLLYAL
jgi:hypothetical protein